MQTSLNESGRCIMELINDSIQKLRKYIPSGECMLCLDPAGSYGLCDQCVKELPVFSSRHRWSYVSLYKPYTLPLEVFSLFRYQWPVANMQHRFKYRGDYHVGNALAQIMARHLAEEVVFSKDWIIVPSPMHWWRRWRRGSNHAAVQAALIASSLSLSIAPSTLSTTRIIKPQVGLSKKQRRENILNAFVCKETVYGKKILLFDDIVTTGSTMREMARTIHRAGATEVKGLSITRGDAR